MLRVGRSSRDHLVPLHCAKWVQWGTLFLYKPRKKPRAVSESCPDQPRCSQFPQPEGETQQKAARIFTGSLHHPQNYSTAPSRAACRPRKVAPESESYRVAASVPSPKSCQPQALVTLKIAQPAHSSPHGQSYFKHTQLAAVRGSRRTTRFPRWRLTFIWRFDYLRSGRAKSQALHIQQLGHRQRDSGTGKRDGAGRAPRAR